MPPLAKRRSESVAALGEEGLIAAIRRWLGRSAPPPPFGMGDDCAVVAGSRSLQLLKIDPVIYRRHFDDTTPPRAVGEKLLKRNVSDIAAMGGRPTAAVVALALDPRTSLSWLEEFHRGLATAARRLDVRIVGGDVSQADGVIVASLALLGTLAGGRPMTRRGGKPGDWIYVTGTLGGSLESGRHHAFEPRLDEGVWLARQPGVRAMMDISDGLAKDVWALTPPGAAPAIDPDAVPRRPGVSLERALCDGEDYELAAVLDRKADRPGFERKWRRAFPALPLTCIGRFVRRSRVPAGAVRLDQLRGYEHLR